MDPKPECSQRYAFVGHSQRKVGGAAADLLLMDSWSDTRNKQNRLKSKKKNLNIIVCLLKMSHITDSNHEVFDSETEIIDQEQRKVDHLMAFLRSEETQRRRRSQNTVKYFSPCSSQWFY